MHVDLFYATLYTYGHNLQLSSG